MKYEITITADTNDGDYIKEINLIDEVELEKIKPLIEAIKNSGLGHNYKVGECGNSREDYDFSEEVFDLFEDLCPYGEYGFHTIESITISMPVTRTELL